MEKPSTQERRRLFLVIRAGREVYRTVQRPLLLGHIQNGDTIVEIRVDEDIWSTGLDRVVTAHEVCHVGEAGWGTTSEVRAHRDADKNDWTFSTVGASWCLDAFEAYHARMVVVREIVGQFDAYAEGAE